MQIVVRGIDGKCVAFEVDLDESIDSLKRKVQENLAFAPDDQILTFRGLPLVAGTISDYCGPDDVVLRLAVAEKGGEVFK
jgi:hypothetical protein